MLRMRKWNKNLDERENNTTVNDKKKAIIEMKEKDNPDHFITTTVPISIFIVSLSLFTYQVTLTRLFSAILAYHYVFLTTSVAILGLGIGSVWAYQAKERSKSTFGEGPLLPADMLLRINQWAVLLSCGFITAFVLIYIRPFAGSLMMCIVLGIIPFVISGYLYAMLFKAWPQASGKFYFADLIGGGVGSVLIVSLLNQAGMFKTVILICLLPLSITFIYPLSNKMLKTVECVIPILLAVCLFLPMQTVNRIEIGFYSLFSDSAKEYGAFERAGLAPEIVFSKWDSFSRTDLMKLESVPDSMFLILDGGATAPMFEFDGDIRNLEKFKTDNGYIPFAVGNPDNVLLIGVGGGLDVLYALAAGVEHISAVEINTASIEAVKQFGDYNGHIFDRPEVTVYGEDGRSFVKNAHEQGARFDLIFMSIVVTNTTQGAGFALSENYLYTVDAMGEYLDCLNDGGRIAFVVHNREATDKLTATAMQALVKRGVAFEDSPDHLVLFHKTVERGGAAEVFDPVIMIQKSPFREDELRTLEERISAVNATPDYLPHLYPEVGLQGDPKKSAPENPQEGSLESSQDAPQDGAQNSSQDGAQNGTQDSLFESPLVRVKSGQIASVEEFVGSFERNAKPAMDDNPYFFNFGRNINTDLTRILVIAAIASFLLFIPYLRRKEHNQKRNERIQPPLYFGLLGMGYMMIETPLIQKFILYLGHPTPAFSYILAAMLIGSGIGGFLNSRRLFRKTVFGVYLPPILAAAVHGSLLLSLGTIFRGTAGFEMPVKIALAAVIALIAGFFMGMPFPRGMALLGESGRKDIIPLMWGINGTMSVVGSVLSIILSMSFGFNIALATGAIIYLSISLFIKI